jgi:Fic family protein
MAIEASLDWASNIKPNKKKALFLAKREVSVFVYDAVQLEGINFTLPEIQTLLEGITIGGHKISDQQIALNQNNAWKDLFDALASNKFEFSKSFACKLHSVAGENEALEWGDFRSGMVSIAGTEYMPPKPNTLNTEFERLVEELDNISDIYDRAIHAFLRMARAQFFYDVNKRMGRFMMNGILLSEGYPAINLPAKKKLEFNQLMLPFYESGDESAMNRFMRSCVEPKTIQLME